jgi:hypothetical protein
MIAYLAISSPTGDRHAPEQAIGMAGLGDRHHPESLIEFTGIRISRSRNRAKAPIPSDIAHAKPGIGGT